MHSLIHCSLFFGASQITFSEPLGLTKHRFLFVLSELQHFWLNQIWDINCFCIDPVNFVWVCLCYYCCGFEISSTFNNKEIYHFKILNKTSHNACKWPYHKIFLKIMAYPYFTLKNCLKWQFTSKEFFFKFSSRNNLTQGIFHIWTFIELYLSQYNVSISF